ncbi:NAD(P)-dependent oxidoreductase [Massilia sp. PAMC28688]|uniref:NAD(P)-dependent oxidoreductase n=1 Tax=Massilia sp. PAMC28688 TaxID=2861283 RepID=UPI001C6322B4|nr:NAD(P)-dependent oxidoreductase [Massilia sp. PAMC28688]QYF95469.1 NAD(P)-dependent oxidoreductase [Massilia sp. PAMC28688]
MNARDNSTVLAFLGTGLMGAPMVRQLLQAGLSVRVWNRTAAKADALRAAGAVPASTPAQAVEGAAVVISMLDNGAVVTQVAAAALAGLAPGALWIDMSSTAHQEALDLHQALAAHGCAFMDAPVSGGVAGAEAATLAIMAGGSADDFARAQPVLACMGRATLVGPTGSGQIAKLCNQLIVGGTLNIVAEALLLAQAAGADPAAVRQAMRGGFAESRILEVHGQRMLERNFVPGGQVRSQLKDLRNVLAAAAEAGVVLPVASLVTQTYASIGATHAGADQSAALLALEQINPGIVLGGQGRA